MASLSLNELKDPRDTYENAYQLLNLRALKIWPQYKIHIFQYMGKIIFMEFIQELVSVFEIILDYTWWANLSLSELLLLK